MILATLSMTDVSLRLLGAVAIGGIIGLEQQMRGRAAGLRTTMLACVASATAVLLGERLFGGLPGGASDTTAASRIMQGILTGIGFLGAGTINREGRLVHGLTSAAVLWIATILGLVVGAGEWRMAMMTAAWVLFILIVLRWIESCLHPDCHGKLTVIIQISGIGDAEIRKLLQDIGIEVKRVSLHYDLEAKRRTFNCDVKYRKHHPFHLAEKVVNELGQGVGVLAVDWTPA
jgi:putative Mg2+ transporter-C (MgtC) family protein